MTFSGFPTMTFSGFPEEALEFYEGLEADNSKAYWQDHKATYKRAVRDPMVALLAALEPEFGSSKFFRPYRDVRFAKDKTPYKTAAGAVVYPRHGSGVLYVQLSARGLMCASGYYETASDQVERFRAAVADDQSGPALVTIVDKLREMGYVIEGDRLKTRPRGYAADHPRIELLRHRTLTAHREFPPEPWLHTPECLDQVIGCWRDFAPLNHWLHRHVGAARAG
jgi:uncharacterized protein (TIGR02453 family)